MERFGLRRKGSRHDTCPQPTSGTIYSLPTDVTVRKICTFLPVADAVRAQSVCKQFQAWFQMSVEMYFDRFEATGLRMEHVSARALIRRMKALREICLRNTSAAVLEDFGVRAGAKLRVFECYGCSVTDLVILSVGRICLGLEKLRLIPAPNESLKVTDASLLYLAKRAPCAAFLKEFTVTCAPGITDRGVSSLLYLCPRLQTLQATHCGISHRFQPPPEFLARVMAAIEDPLNDQNSDEEEKQLDPSALERHMPTELRHLDVSGNHELGAAVVLSIPGIGGLKKLRLSGAASLTDTAIQYISVHCPHLEELSIANCPSVTDAGLEIFAQGLAALTLKHLDIARCLKISDSGVVAIARFGKLVTLDAQGCFRVTDYSLRILGAKCGSLRAVNFKGLSVLTDDGMEQLCSGCPDLESIVLSSCIALGDDSLVSIAKYCGNIKRLDLFCVHRISDDGLLVLAKGCSELEELDVSWCFRLSSEFFKNCRERKYWPKLRKLGVQGLEEKADTTSASQAAANVYLRSAANLGKYQPQASSAVDCRSPLEMSPLSVPRKPCAVDEISPYEGDEAITSKKRTRQRRASSLHRQDSSSSLSHSKKPVPGIVLDVAGSPRIKQLPTSSPPTMEELSALSLNDSSDHAPSPMHSPLQKGQSSFAVKTLSGSSRRYGDHRRDLEREFAFAHVESDEEATRREDRSRSPK